MQALTVIEIAAIQIGLLRLLSVFGFRNTPFFLLTQCSSERTIPGASLQVSPAPLYR